MKISRNGFYNLTANYKLFDDIIFIYFAAEVF